MTPGKRRRPWSRAPPATLRGLRWCVPRRLRSAAGCVGSIAALIRTSPASTIACRRMRWLL